eukprot:TCONS_00004524-protein
MERFILSIWLVLVCVGYSSSRCISEYSKGRFTASRDSNCSNSGYTSIPWKEIPYYRRAILFMNNNKITQLRREDFAVEGKKIVLYLHGNPIKTLQANVFYDLKDLRELSVSAEEIEDGAFNGLTNLQYLWIIGSEKLTSLPRNILKSLPNLKELSINSTGITTIQSRFLAGFEHLTFVDLSHNKIRTIEKNVMEKTFHVDQIRLNGNQLNKIPSDLVKRLKRLDLSKNHFTRIGEDQFSMFTELTHLDLSVNNLQELPSNIFKHNTQLQSLKLQRTNISFIPSINLLNNLHYLDISFNHLEKLSINTNGKILSGGGYQLRFLKIRNSGLKKLYFSGGQRSFKELDISENCFVKHPYTRFSIKVLNVSNSCLNETIEPYYNGADWVMDLHGNNYRNVIVNRSRTHYQGSIILSHNKIERIQIRSDSLKLLDLSYNVLSSTSNILIPTYLNIDIGKFILKGNQIHDLQSKHMKKIQVTHLDLSDNNISQFPNTMLNPSAIKYMNFANNKIAHVPKTISTSFSNLIELNLRNNSLVSLPYAIFSDASTLKKFDLSSNDLKCSCNLTITLNLMQNKDSIVGSCVDDTFNKQNLTSFTGDIAEISKDTKCNLCPIDPCSCRGECKASEQKGFLCKCDEGYTGRHCQFSKSSCFLTQTCGLCNDTICGEHGTCKEVSPTDYKCKCKAGYTGTYCNIPQCILEQNCGLCSKNSPCNGNGTCQEILKKDGSISNNCTCYEGYSGNRCQHLSLCKACKIHQPVCESYTHGCKCSGKVCILNCVETQSCGLCTEGYCMS